MRARVRVGGFWLDSVGPVSDLRDSTIFRTKDVGQEKLGWSGDYQATCSWRPPRGLSASWLHRGATFEVIEGGLRTWGGLLSEPGTPDDDGTLTLSAYGFGSAMENYQALYDPPPAGPTNGPLQPWQIPNDVVDRAFDDLESPVNRWSNTLGTTSVASGAGEIVDVATVLDRAALAAGLRWSVDSFGEIALVGEPTTPDLILRPRGAYLGSADDDFVTHLYGYYVTGVDGTTGLPNAWDIVVAGDDEMAEKNGRRERTVDLTAMGVLTQSAAQANIDGRFALVGARMGWTTGVDLSFGLVMKPGWGAVSPLRARAGTMLRIPGVTDLRSTPTVRAMVDIVLGQVDRIHAERRAFATPIGFAPRDFQGALAAGQAPTESVTAA